MDSSELALEPVRSITSGEAAHTLLAGFLGWTLDAFDFFILTFVITTTSRAPSAGRGPDIALTITLALATRPIGAFIFGMMADRFGRRLPLMLNVVFYSVVESLPDSRRATNLF